jgi:hypothetical protein
MKSKEILKLWNSYLNSHTNILNDVKNKNEIGIVYGTDEIKIDKKKKRLRIPDVGWVDFPELDVNFKPDWTVICSNDLVVVGIGDPFSKYACRNILIKAVIPFSVVSCFFNHKGY